MSRLTFALSNRPSRTPSTSSKDDRDIADRAGGVPRARPPPGSSSRCARERGLLRENPDAELKQPIHRGWLPHRGQNGATHLARRRRANGSRAVRAARPEQSVGPDKRASLVEMLTPRWLVIPRDGRQSATLSRAGSRSDCSVEMRVRVRTCSVSPAPRENCHIRREGWEAVGTGNGECNRPCADLHPSIPDLRAGLSVVGRPSPGRMGNSVSGACSLGVFVAARRLVEAPTPLLAVSAR